MADTNNTIKTTVVVDVTQAQQQIIKLGAAASDTTKTLESRIAAKNKQVKLQEQLSKQTIANLEKQKKALEGVTGKEKELEKVQKKLNAAQIRATKSTAQNTKQLNKLIATQNKAGKSSKGLLVRIKGLNSQLLGAAGLAGGVSAVIEGFKSFVNASKELTKIQKSLHSAFDLTNRQAREVSANIRAISSTFEQDYNDVLQASIAVSKELGISVEEATDRIEEGFLKGSDNGGEFLAILKEYPAQFRAAGIDAEATFAIINQTAQEGIYSDKGIDAIKEGGIRLRENTKAVQEALAPLKEGTRLQIQQEIAAGRSFEAIKLVSKSLTDTSLTADETQKIVADVFGGAGEDAGLRYIEMLQDIDTSLEDVAIQSSVNEQATLELEQSYNGFVSSVASSDGIFSQVTAKFKAGLAGIFKSLERYNEGLDFQSQVLLENKKAQGLVNQGLEKQRQLLSSVTDEEERKELITKRSANLKKAISEQQKEIDKESAFASGEEAVISRSKLLTYQAQLKELEKISSIQEEAADNTIKQQKRISTADAKEAAKKEERRKKAEEEQTERDAQRLLNDEAAREKAEALKIQNEEERKAEARQREIDSQLEFDEQMLEAKRLNGENVLAEELSLMERRRLIELENQELTGKEISLINQKYLLAETQLVETAEKAKSDSKKAYIKQALGAAAEAFGISQELAVAEMLMAAPQAIGNSFKEAAKVYAPPLSIAMGALGAAGTVAPIVKGLIDIKKTRFSAKGKGGGGGGGGSISAPTGAGGGRTIAPEAIADVSANNSARMGVDSSIGSTAGADAANNVIGGESQGIVFSENKYTEFQEQVDFKENKTTI